MATFRFTAHLNDCRSERNSRYCTYALSLFSLLVNMYCPYMCNLKNMSQISSLQLQSGNTNNAINQGIIIKHYVSLVTFTRWRFLPGWNQSKYPIERNLVSLIQVSYIQDGMHGPETCVTNVFFDCHLSRSVSTFF